jgi:predicted metal-dependent hydrolase
VVERPGRAHIEIDGDRLILYVPASRSAAQRRKILDGWYREQLRQVIPDLIAKWESKLDVRVPAWNIRRMRTKWGTCNRETRRITFNIELAKKHPDCLEYMAVHEIMHYFERGHGERFTKLMDDAMSDWRSRRDALNAAPLANEAWSNKR